MSPFPSKRAYYHFSPELFPRPEKIVSHTITFLSFPFLSFPFLSLSYTASLIRVFLPRLISSTPLQHRLFSLHPLSESFIDSLEQQFVSGRASNIHPFKILQHHSFLRSQLVLFFNFLYSESTLTIPWRATSMLQL
jgi:hypothetical protein